MSEEVQPGGTPTAGAMLRQAREAAGLHIAAVAVGMKVPVKKLEALEADRYESLGDPVFVRALASGMCRALKLDPTAVLEKLPQYVKPKLRADTHSINAPFKESAAGGASMPALVGRPAFQAVAVLLLAALGVLFWPESEEAGVSAQTEGEPNEVIQPVAAMAQPAMPVADAPSIPAETAPAAPAAPAAAPTTVSLPASAPLPPATAAVPLVASAAAPVAVGAVAPAASAPALVPAVTNSGVLVLRTQAESWVQVVDAKGTVQLRRILQAGEKASVGGELPLAVIVGRADATAVEIRGKAFKLEALSQDNVARFEVK